MNLHEAAEFQDALLAAAQDLDLDERFVEKDYYLTEVLRVVVRTHPDRTILKGGTSLSKGWQLIDRFSEDIDLFVDPEAWTPPLGKNGVDRELKLLRDAIASHPALSYVEGEGNTIGGLSREDYFKYDSLFDELPGLRSAILLEPGVQSGRQPTEAVQISSMVGEYLRGHSASDLADDVEPFEMTLLHFRRTFVEKLFIVHGKVERLRTEGHPLGRDARHYADLHALADRPEVLEMLSTSEYDEIRGDYAQLSRRFYPTSYRPPPELSFAGSDALTLPAELRGQIEVDYEAECRRLFPGPYPSLDDVIERLGALRDEL
ncbi:MAG: nucleotidyl transferase AbiEii/AbiGii toxin family protein [Solirubrobacterales bacterium]